MKDFTCKDIKTESFVVFSLPDINFYIDKQKLKNLLKFQCDFLSKSDCGNSKGCSFITVSDETFKKEFLTIEQVEKKIACALNAYIDEYNKEKEEKRIKVEKQLEEFEKNGFEHYSLLKEDFSKQQHLHELQNYAKYMLENVETWRKDKDQDMMVCEYCDAKDVTKILYYLKVGDIKKASEESHLLDTIVREGIPDTVWDLFILYKV